MKKLICYALLAAMTMPNTSCDKETMDALADLYIPDFSNQWTVDKGTQTGSLFFINDSNIDSTKITGVLEAFDNNQDGNVYNLKGSFDHRNVKLHYLTKAENDGFDNGPFEGIQYEGKFDTMSKPFRLRLVNISKAGDSLVLKHG